MYYSFDTQLWNICNKQLHMYFFVSLELNLKFTSSFTLFPNFVYATVHVFEFCYVSFKAKFIRLNSSDLLLTH